MIYLQFLVLLVAILVGARMGGIGLGIAGGLGLVVLTFVFNIFPTSPPIDVMLMIMAVVAAASCMQAAGGLSYLVSIAEKALRNNPRYITYMAPFITYVFTMIAGTGHVAYSVLPVIAEVSKRTGIRPERPMSMAVIASQFAIVACPISAAVVTLAGILAPADITIFDILIVTVPSTFLGLFLAAIIVNKMGKELHEDPACIERMAQQEAQDEDFEINAESVDDAIHFKAKLSVYLFLFGSFLVVILGAIPSLRPVFIIGGEEVKLGMAPAIEIVMLAIAFLIALFCKVNQDTVTRGSVFHAGMRAVIAIFGIAWLGDSFFAAHNDLLRETATSMVQSAPWLFALILFFFSVMVNSQGATTVVLMPLGLALGIPAPLLIAMFVAVNGYFFIPNYGPIIASIDFDSTGSTKIGKYIFNHSFMIPGLLSMLFSLLFAFAFAKLFL